MAMQSADHGPIDPAFHEQMNALAHALDHIFNPALPGLPRSRKVGFFLTTFLFDETEGRFNYISNADKGDVRVMLREVLARLEGRLSEEGHA